MTILNRFKWHRNTNITWLILLLIATASYVFCSIFCSYSLCSQNVTRVINDIIISTFSSVVLLLLFEIILFRRDNQRLGYLGTCKLTLKGY